MRTFNITVNGKTYAVEVEETSDGASVTAAAPVAPVAAPAKPVAENAAGTQVKAPMPGLVLKLAVANGASVNKGDKLVVLEAMKMENDITAPAAGVVQFAVKQGDSVETGALLATIG